MDKFKPVTYDQLYLLPPSINDFISEDHFARVVNEVVETIDFTNIEKNYSVLGQKSYSPKVLLKLLFYGYSTGIRSGRKIAGACEQDTAYMYLACMYRPDFRTINDFRKNNLEFIQDCFMHIVRLCRELGMAKAGMLILDGSKLKANANASNTKTKAHYEAWLKSIETEIEQILQEAQKQDAMEDEHLGNKRGDEIPKALQSKEKLKKKIEQALSKIDGKGKINIVDNDAGFMKGKGGIDLNYNCQAAITEDGVIVGAYTSNNPSDRSETIRAVENAEKVAGFEFTEILADSGYATYDNYEYLTQKGKDIYIPDQQMENEKVLEQNPYHRNNFKYDIQNDRFTCPEGKILNYEKFSIHKKTKQKAKVYKCKECNLCNNRELCTKGKYRSINVEEREHIRNKIREKLESFEGKCKYVKRMRIEPIFGNMKHNLGYRHLYLNGTKKVSAEWQLMCIGHNLKKLYKNKAA